MCGAFVFPQEAIDFLKACQYDPNAQPGYELISGGLFWDDERFLDFTVICRSRGCNDYGVLFAYRTSLIEGKPREELRYAWEEVRLRCSNWIGFRSERMSPDPKLQALLREQEDCC